MAVKACFLPLFHGQFTGFIGIPVPVICKKFLFLTGNIVVNIAVHVCFSVEKNILVDLYRSPVVRDEYIVHKGDHFSVLFAGRLVSLEIGVMADPHGGFPAECKDVPADNVFSAVMLVISVAAALIDHVPFQHNVGRSFIRVKSPAPVIAAGNVVNCVPPDPGTRLDAQQIHPAHVGEDLFAQIVNVVVVDPDLPCGGIGVAPDPAAGNTGVVEIVDMIIFQQAAPRMLGDDPDGCQIELTAIVDVVAPDDDLIHLKRGFFLFGRIVHAVQDEAAAAQIVQMVVPERQAGTSLICLNSVPGAAADLTVLHHAV